MTKLHFLQYNYDEFGTCNTKLSIILSNFE